MSGVADEHLRVMNARELEAVTLPDAVPVVAGLLLRGSVAAIVGEPGLGKSLLLVGLGVAVASGQPWLGRAVGPASPVLIVPAEGRLASWRARLIAAAGARGLAFRELAISVLGHQVGISHPYVRTLNLPGGDHADVYTAAMALRPALVILDPLADLHEGDENAVKDVRPVLGNLRTLAAQTGALVMVAHHSRKPANQKNADDADDPKHSVRGSSAIVGALDTILTLRRLGPDAVEIAVAKQRDLPMESGPIAAVEIVQMDESAVVRPIDVKSAQGAAALRSAEAKATQAVAKADAAVLAAVKAQGGPVVLSVLVGLCGIRHTDARAAVERLVAAGRLRKEEAARPDDQGRPHPVTVVIDVEGPAP